MSSASIDRRLVGHEDGDSSGDFAQTPDCHRHLQWMGHTQAVNREERAPQGASTAQRKPVWPAELSAVLLVRAATR